MTPFFNVNGRILKQKSKFSSLLLDRVTVCLPMKCVDIVGLVTAFTQVV